MWAKPTRYLNLMNSTITEPPVTGVATRRRTRPSPRTKPRMLLIVNPFATTVSGRLKNLVVYALRGRYDIEAVETQRPNHATELTRQAVGEGFDVVVSFGGDGTLNEAANGLAGTNLPLSVLPGGSTNVVCRMLGHPDRRGRRDRASAAARRRPRAAPRRHGPGQRALLHLLQRRRDRRRRHALGRRPPAAEGARRRCDVHLRGAAQLLPRLPRQAAAARGAGRRPARSPGSARSSRTRIPTPLPLHPAARVRGHRHGRRHDLRHDHAPRVPPARRAGHPVPAVRAHAPAGGAPAGSELPAHPAARPSARSRRPRRCRSRSTATTSATAARPCTRPRPARCWSSPNQRRGTEPLRAQSSVVQAQSSGVRTAELSTLIARRRDYFIPAPPGRRRRPNRRCAGG